ncbi:prepilin-type N-terminal cleavage/methylation domain-containing protein [Candidatus Kaiserbacteria bacterium]|nr:prepilin-type N-terminal cleavage/methylation domain-containing protein [Candidatus Kaiserbacteria bacterium]
MEQGDLAVRIRAGMRGFTVIELLVVVAIIGLLSSVIAVSVSGYRSRGRDTRRLEDVQQLRQALELYNSTSG